ncbi:Hypothetical protein R9X50_00417600 [Acrodontium crateriforme]|uniref:histidine kinase n=1 Tax=Acrodontium crateriforme TaxID=150365 RepID=A0AAQ3RAJ0_9PEZI|nr:Hypothetical protein R9X50_00417600 [Acrodontium crateriforme]
MLISPGMGKDGEAHEDDKDAAIDAVLEGRVKPNMDAATQAGNPDLQTATNVLQRIDPPEWTNVLPKTEHLSLFLGARWEQTDLGPLASWGPALRFAATMVFADSRASCLYWGRDRIAFYNEGFKLLAGEAHPRLMAAPFRVGFPELDAGISQVFNVAESSGMTVDVDNIELFTDRGNLGYREETYFVGQFIPVRGDGGEVAGFYNTTYESTEHVCFERWRQLTNCMGAIRPGPVDQTVSRFVDAMRSNPRDIPMAILYSYPQPDSTDGANILRSHGNIGIPADHRCFLPVLDLSVKNCSLAALVRHVQIKGKQLALPYSDPRLTDEIGHICDDVAWTGFGEPSHHIIVTPLLDSARRPLGVLIHGTNPRRPFDDKVKMPIEEMIRQMESKWMSSISTDQARAREKILERRLTDSERKMRHVARSCPFGMVQITPQGEIEFANDQFYDILGFSKGDEYPTLEEFFVALMPEAIDIARSRLAGMMTGEDAILQELRLKKMWTPPAQFGDTSAPEPVHGWILTTGVTEKDEEGRPISIMGFVTDISHQKWAQDVQSRNAAAANLAKRQQEKFIDTTSHEMRNPLMAMTQLADGIARSLEDFEVQDDDKQTLEKYKTILQCNVEDASTILACAMHQKRIIDDVLILSRLESEMLSIKPVAEYPGHVVEAALRMFAAQADANEIELSCVQDRSFEDLRAQHVLCDPSRLVQVLINLIGNAVKFTASEDMRKVSLVYGAQSKTPEVRSVFGDITWLPVKNKHLQENLSAKDDPVWIYFLVQDTGPGLTPEDADKLFKRFSQGESRAQTTYEGSGLGLYICRELVEKQGGQVGVASEYGKGSVFGFYICTSRVTINEASTLTGPRSESIQPVTPDFKDQVKVAETSTPKSTIPVRAVKPGSQTAKYHILLAEDNLINQRVLGRQLKKAGCTVTVANHGAEALELLKATDCWKDPRDSSKSNGCSDPDESTSLNPPVPIDVLVLDWEMPVMNGLECAAKIRTLQREGSITRHLPILSITANIRQEQIEQALAAGMDDVLPKPFTIADLLAKLRVTLEPSEHNAQPNDGYEVG